MDAHDAHDDVMKWKHFRIIGPLWRESTGHIWFPLKRPVMQSFDGLFYVRLNKRLSKTTIDILVIWDAMAIIMTSL